MIKPKRGRKAIPDSWSRVISLNQDDLTKLKVYELAPDLLMSGAMKQTITRGKEVKEYAPAFWPETYANDHDMDLASHKLSS